MPEGAGADAGTGEADPAPATETCPTEESLHKKFVAYVQALSGSSETRSPVWIEHSYARAWRSVKSATPVNIAKSPHFLLMRREPPPDCQDVEDIVDVEAMEKELEPPLSPELPPHYEQELNEEDIMMASQDTELDDWEEKLDSLAPSPAHRSLASTTLELIRSLRMGRLSGAPRSAKAHARRLRRALATLWNYPGPQQQRPAAWMHAALTAYLPRPYLHAYNDMLSELQRTVPHLVDRLMAGYVQTAAPEAEATGPRVQPSPDKPLLVWMPSGRDKRDARWERRLKHLMPVLRIKAPIVSACNPESWCAAVASTARTALLSFAGTPRSALVLGGWGAGAALAIHIAHQWDTNAGPAPKCLALLAPPLLTAEGPRDVLDDPMFDLKIPMLFVIGQNAMQSSVTIAEEVRSRLGVWSQLVVVGSADDALRLTHHKRRNERVTQQMIDAALAEEVCGFVTRALSEGDDPPDETPDGDTGPCDRDEDTAVSRRRSANEPLPQPLSIKRPRRSTDRSPTPPTVSPTPPPAALSPTVISPPASQGKDPIAQGKSPTAQGKASVNQVKSPVAQGRTPVTQGKTPVTQGKAPMTQGKGRGLALLRVSSAPPDGSILHAGRASIDWDEPSNSNDSYANIMDNKRNIKVTDASLGPVTNGGSTKSSPRAGPGFSVVSRFTGGVPLALPPLRRSTASPAPAPPTSLAPQDIMDLPIVFADDDRLDVNDGQQKSVPLSEPPPLKSSAPIKYTRYTKVILAKRPGPTAGGTGTSPVNSSPGARPIIVKGGMKLLPSFVKRSPTKQSPQPNDKSPV